MHCCTNLASPAVLSGMLSYTLPLAEEEHLSNLKQTVARKPICLIANCVSVTMQIFYSDKPHNPMINAGAMVLSSLIKPHNTITERTNFVSQLVFMGD